MKNKKLISFITLLIMVNSLFTNFSLVHATEEDYITVTVPMTFSRYKAENGSYGDNSSNGYNYVIENSKDYSAKLLPNEGFKLPQNILVKVGDIDLAINDYTYNSINGELIIPISLINENITIEAIGREIYEVIFDANDGEFSNGNPVLKYDDADNCDFDNIETPTRSGYEFIGYYTEKTGGTSFDDIMNSEAGIESDITFYARWEEIPKQENVTKEEPSKELDETPKMGSNIQKDNLILITVLIATSIFKSLMIYKKSK